ncbi:sugar kinase [Propionibacteriaceae bacterium G1746]|uniref:sugar kinase n=1 Tax=Aestuariimicrobium sp. G57 TaxID=3418485 RepID=UPI003C1E28A3
MNLQLKPADDCRYDAVALGEVMLRLDPGEDRIRSARTFSAWEGGGEYNVIRGLSRVFGWRTGVLTALVDNEVGHLVEGLMLAGGVDTSRVVWQPHDGIGRELRNGLNFTERGFGVRGAVGVSDRGHTAMSQLRPEELDLDGLFDQGVRWLHTGGICAGLSRASGELVLDVVRRAKQAGVVVSYDLNYRPSLWQGIGGQAAAQEVNREIARHVDVMLGNEEDFTACLGFEVEGNADGLGELDRSGYEAMIARVAAEYPQLAVIGTTLREVHSASRNSWGAMAWSPGTGVVHATQRDDIEILDRVGGGDSFASGLVHGLLAGEGLARAVDLGAAHGALAMTTPGDVSRATRREVEKLADGGSARVLR